MLLELTRDAGLECPVPRVVYARRDFIHQQFAAFRYEQLDRQHADIIERFRDTPRDRLGLFALRGAQARRNNRAAKDVVAMKVLGRIIRLKAFIPTTRGDRLFISLIMAAVIHLLWIGLVGNDTILTLPVGEEGIELSSLWLATVISLVSAVAIFRTV